MSIPWVDSEDDLTIMDLESSTVSSSRYFTKDEAAHVFLFCSDHLFFQQTDILDWQLFRLNSIIKVNL
jgi:hypothetical protein